MTIYEVKKGIENLWMFCLGKDAKHFHQWLENSPTHIPNAPDELWDDPEELVKHWESQMEDNYDDGAMDDYLNVVLEFAKPWQLGPNPAVEKEAYILNWLLDIRKALILEMYKYHTTKGR